eukprot:UN26555
MGRFSENLNEFISLCLERHKGAVSRRDFIDYDFLSSKDIIFKVQLDELKVEDWLLMLRGMILRANLKYEEIQDLEFQKMNNTAVYKAVRKLNRYAGMELDYQEVFESLRKDVYGSDLISIVNECADFKEKMVLHRGYHSAFSLTRPFENSLSAYE